VTLNASKSGPRVLLIGKTGQVGGDLDPLLSEFAEVHATDRSTLDLLQPESIRKVIRNLLPDVIVNAAAYTAVDKAEVELAIAHSINTIAPTVLAEEAARAHALLVHYSTDYVFDGMKSEAYVESDAVNPINVYGRTKAEGEEGITRSGCRHLIFRTSWVYSSRGSNFLLTILRLAREREELRIVNDQIGAPTSSHSLAVATASVIRSVWTGDLDESSSIYHMTAAGRTSWFEFAREILEQASILVRIPKPRLIPISTEEYVTAARRPLNSVLSCEKLRIRFGILMPPWQESLGSVLRLLSKASVKVE
jgi:dTDP-4-dehydrorhamnose reductase